MNQEGYATDTGQLQLSVMTWTMTGLWLYNDKSPKTRKEYHRDIDYFVVFLNGKPL